LAGGLAILSLVLILILQLAWFDREQLVYTPAGRSLLTGLCRVAGCEPPPRRALDRFVILSREILARDEQPGVLHLRLVFANQAAFAQPFPRIQVSLLSAQGHPQAQRSFSPEEYLAPGGAAGGLMQPRSPIPVSLDLVDPNKGWAGYRFDFL